MVKKITKILLSTALCAALATGATAISSHAYKDPKLCPHSYHILEDSYRVYTYMNHNQHRITGWEEYYCMDCFSYWTEPVNITEDHILPCPDCGAE